MEATPVPPLEMAGFEMKTAIITIFYLGILAVMAAAPMLVAGIVIAGFVWHAAVNWGE